MAQTKEHKNTQAKLYERKKQIPVAELRASKRRTNSLRPYHPHCKDAAWVRDLKILLRLATCQKWTRPEVRLVWDSVTNEGA